MSKLKVGLIINPLAGLGGSVALKGSDNVAEQALALGAVPMANKRAGIALGELLEHKDNIEIFTVNGDMGQSACEALGLTYQVIAYSDSDKTTAQDSRNAVTAMAQAKVDIILFAGGDGTARDICSMVEEQTLVLGIPAGCKIHSGVYAVTPKAAGRVMAMMAQGQMLSVGDADVMDIDEEAFRKGNVKAKLYGEMQVPAELRYIQATKSGGKESNELVLQGSASILHHGVWFNRGVYHGRAGTG